MEPISTAFWLGMILAYFLPTAIAATRDVEHLFLITFINLIVGWSGIGWLACVIWAGVAKTEGA